MATRFTSTLERGTETETIVLRVKKTMFDQLYAKLLLYGARQGLVARLTDPFHDYFVERIAPKLTGAPDVDDEIIYEETIKYINIIKACLKIKPKTPPQQTTVSKP